MEFFLPAPENKRFEERDLFSFMVHQQKLDSEVKYYSITFITAILSYLDLPRTIRTLSIFQDFFTFCDIRNVFFEWENRNLVKW
jgi:hypothetical protein